MAYSTASYAAAPQPTNSVTSYAAAPQPTSPLRVGPHAAALPPPTHVAVAVAPEARTPQRPMPFNSAALASSLAFARGIQMTHAASSRGLAAAPAPDALPAVVSHRGAAAAVREWPVVALAPATYAAAGSAPGSANAAVGYESHQATPGRHAHASGRLMPSYSSRKLPPASNTFADAPSLAPGAHEGVQPQSW
jgi:hypothetical protein